MWMLVRVDTHPVEHTIMVEEQTPAGGPNPCIDADDSTTTSPAASKQPGANLHLAGRKELGFEPLLDHSSQLKLK